MADYSHFWVLDGIFPDGGAASCIARIATDGSQIPVCFALAHYPLNCCDDSHVASAAAKIAAELLPNVALCRVWKAQHYISRCHQHSRCAEAALQSVMLTKGGAQRAHNLVVIETFDGPNLAAVQRKREDQA